MIFGKGAYQEAAARLPEIIRSIDKKIDYGAHKGKDGLTYGNEISLAWAVQGFADGKQLEPHWHQNI